LLILPGPKSLEKWIFKIAHPSLGSNPLQAKNRQTPAAIQQQVTNALPAELTGGPIPAQLNPVSSPIQGYDNTLSMTIDVSPAGAGIVSQGNEKMGRKK